MCVCRHTTAHAWRPEDNRQPLSVESVFSFQPESSGIELHVTGVGSKPSRLLSPSLAHDVRYRKEVLSEDRVWDQWHDLAGNVLATKFKDLSSIPGIYQKVETGHHCTALGTLSWLPARGHRILNPIQKKRSLGKKSRSAVLPNRNSMRRDSDSWHTLPFPLQWTLQNTVLSMLH